MSKIEEQLNDYAIYGLEESAPIKSRRAFPDRNFFKDLILEIQRINDNLELIHQKLPLKIIKKEASAVQNFPKAEKK